MNWMTTQNRKKLQRSVNRIVRKVNRVIEQDDLWKGRFFIYQSNAAWISGDNSGWRKLIVTLEYVDKKTGQKMTYMGDANLMTFWDGAHLLSQMNYFIVDVCGVWEDTEGLYQDKTDWTKVKVR